jgi:ABC-type phosphate transport system substrate-binding protein
MKKIYIIIIAVFLLTIGSASTFAQEYKIIVNSGNSIDALTKKELSDYFLKKKTTWTGNTSVLPIDLNSSSATRAVFSKEIHNKSISQVRAFWQQSVFSGKASPPTELENDIAVINYIKSHKDAIGYISSKSSPSGVKVINIK